MKKWLKRTTTGIIMACLSFVFISIVNKLIFKYDDWLFRTIMMSVPWIAITLLKYHFVVDKGWKQWVFLVDIAIIAFGATLFVTGVCLSLDNCWNLAWYITFCFTYPVCFTPLQDKN